VIELPPLLLGAVHVKETCALPAVAVSDVGAAGAEAGVAVAEELLVPVPTELMAATENE